MRQQAAAGTLHQGRSIASGDMLGRSPYHRVDPTPVGPSPFFDCGSAAAEPHIRSPLTSRLTPKSLMLEVVGLGRADQSLSRHLAARTLCGPPAEIGTRVSFPREWLSTSSRRESRSRRFTHPPLRA